MADSNNDELIGFIGGRFEAMNERFEAIGDRLHAIERHMATKEDLARLDGRLSERIEVATTSIRGDIEQVQLRLDSMEHSIASRFENVEGEISRLRSAVYVLGKDRPDVLRLLGHQTS
ncbi:MAG: hypothetical protein ACXWID_11735 [Pyrinomonadaceae bacterium]